MVRIRFDTIKIESLSDSSSVNNGVNILIGRTSTERINESMGTVGGNRNLVENGLHVLGRTPAGRPNGDGD